MSGNRAFLVVSLAFLGLAAPVESHAFHLGDHKRITIQAVGEFNRCFPGLISSFDELTLWGSDLDEDIDIFRKDLVYSHFFNPYKHLRMRRFDSSVRVGSLEQAILGDVEDGDRGSLSIYVHLGHAVHHIQDMAVPPHVVPVMHGLGDGFEKFSFDGDISSELSCEELVTGTEESLGELLVDTARETLATVDSEHLAGFWQASSDDSFGQYGEYGNRFGEAVDGVPADFYPLFKQRQMKLAVRSTVRALYWLLVAHGL